MKVLVGIVITAVILQCAYSDQLRLPKFYSEEYERFARHIRQKKHFDWQIADPTEPPETTTRPAATSTLPPPEISTVNITSLLIRDGTVQINPDEIMHKEEAEGIGDVGLILWGSSHKLDVTKPVEATVTEVKKSITRNVTRSNQQISTEVPKEISLKANNNSSSENANENLEHSTVPVIEHTTHVPVEISTETYLPIETNSTEPSITTTNYQQLPTERMDVANTVTDIENATSIKTISHVDVPSTTSIRPVVGSNVIAILAKMIATPGDIKILKEIGNMEPAITESPAIMIIPSEPTSTESNIEKIMDTMPSANEDVIRVIKLKQDQRYGKGMAKPKYISMALAHMNSTEYDENEESKRSSEMSNSTSMTMETHSEYSISVAI